MKEADFSRSLSGMITKYGYRVTRIESHGTGNGIPDMFVDGHGDDFWLELKAEDKYSVNDKVINVDWRPGQVPWMYEYYVKHRANKCCLTLVHVSDGMFIIPMLELFKSHKVHNPIGWSRHDPFNLIRMLTAAVDCNYWSENFLGAINLFCDKHYPGIDYDPECLMNPELLEKPYDSKVFNYQKLNMILTLESTILNL